MSDTLQNRISFHFQPFDYESKGHIVEKSIDGKKQRYFVGIASGMKVDQHGERMTQNAIQDLMTQANSGTVLLFPDLHGIKASEDIGILTTAKVMPNGDWYVEFRLYSEEDGIPQAKLDTINVLWAQINGDPPYKKPLQKGFSIEGFIPEGGILSMTKDGKNRVIDKIVLDGVILVPRPAYQDGIANAVFKALGELAPWQSEKYTQKVRKSLQDKITERKEHQTYYSSKFELNDALDSEIEEIMNSEKLTNSQKESELNIVFEEYKQSSIQLILSSQALFQNGDGANEINKSDRRDVLYAKLNDNLMVLKSYINKRKGIN